MIVFHKVSEMRIYINSQKESGKTIGFVPTMGALHDGHLSLIDRAKKDCDVVIASVFVNPTQFNSKEDFEKYPIMTGSDTDKLKSVDCDILFLPTVAEMYENIDLKIDNPIEIGYLDSILEGKMRPGHYKGVVTIVEKLFLAVCPDQVFMGLKDFQQVKVIEKLIEDRSFPIKLIGCPTLRESNGLAMSSRNMRLSDKGREEAKCIFQALSFIKENRGCLSPNEIILNSKSKFLNEMEVEYLELRNAKDLSEVNLDKWENLDYVVLFAGKMEEVRLIDNLEF